MKNKWFIDLIHGAGIYLVMRYNKYGAAELMEKWADALKHVDY